MTSEQSDTEHVRIREWVYVGDDGRLKLRFEVVSQRTGETISQSREYDVLTEIDPG